MASVGKPLSCIVFWLFATNYDELKTRIDRLSLVNYVRYAPIAETVPNHDSYFGGFEKTIQELVRSLVGRSLTVIYCLLANWHQKPVKED